MKMCFMYDSPHKGLLLLFLVSSVNHAAHHFNFETSTKANGITILCDIVYSTVSSMYHLCLQSFDVLLKLQYALAWR